MGPDTDREIAKSRSINGPKKIIKIQVKFGSDGAARRTESTVLHRQLHLETSIKVSKKAFFWGIKRLDIIYLLEIKKKSNNKIKIIYYSSINLTLNY